MRRYWQRSNREWRLLCAGSLVFGMVAGSAGRAAAQDPPASPEPVVTVPDDGGQATTPTPPEKAEPAPAAQDPGTATKGFVSTFLHNLGDDVKHIPRRNTYYWLVGGAAASLAVHPADKKVNRHLAGSASWDNFFKPGKYLGGTPVMVGASAATYIIGRARGEDRVRHLGMDFLEAQALTEGVVEVAKAIGRRPRPLNPDGTKNSTKSFSFPSGHAAVTFATATVLQQHLGWKFAVPTYLVASYVAISRLHDNRHYLSDVVMGAATGVIIGRSVTWHGRNNYPIAPAVGPDFLGLAIEWK
jgi:membrane-associated phospholipid phosphatase